MKKIQSLRSHLAQLKQPSISQDHLACAVQALQKGLDSLENLDSSWIEAFRSEWWELELICAVMLDSNIEKVPADSIVEIHRVASQMEELLRALEEKGA